MSLCFEKLIILQTNLWNMNFCVCMWACTMYMQHISLNKGPFPMTVPLLKCIQCVFNHITSGGLVYTLRQINRPFFIIVQQIFFLPLSLSYVCCTDGVLL